MMNETRYISKPSLRTELARQERSAAWLARKIGVSQQLMSFVLRNERTISETKARLAVAVLGGDDIGSFFAPITTSVASRTRTHLTEAA
jgi:hypothetical protein